MVDEFQPHESLAQKLEWALASGDIVIFGRGPDGDPHEIAAISREEMKALREMIRIWQGVNGVWMLAGLVRNLLFLAALATASFLWLKGKLDVAALLGPLK